MSSDQKCEWPVNASSRAGTSVVDRPSSSTTSSSSSTASHPSCSASSSSTLVEQHPKGRQRLQRGAKDKVYATRLAADCNLHCESDNHVKSCSSSLVDSVTARTRKDVHNQQLRGRECETIEKNSVVSNTGNASSVKQRKFDGIKPDATLKRKYCEENLKRKRKQSASNDNVNSNKRENRPNDCRKSCNEEQHMQHSSTSSNIISINKNHEQQGSLLGSPERLINQPSPTNASCALKQTTNNYSQSAHVAAEPPPSNEWSCSQCTCFNSSRRRKCQACGIPRYLMVGSDGTFMLDELCRANYDSGTSVNCEEISGNSNIPLTASASNHPSFSRGGESQLFAMMDAPVYTRSKRKEQLSQTTSSSLTQPDEMEKSDNGILSCPWQQYPSTSEQPSHYDPQPEGGSEFQQWIRKRHTVKREKRQRGNMSRAGGNNNNPFESASLEEMKRVTVRIRTGVRDGAPTFVNQQRSLIANVPTAVLARIALEHTGTPNISSEKESSREMKSVTVRIRALIGQRLVSCDHQTDSPKNAEVDQLEACIPLPVIARISLRSTLLPNANGDRNDCNKRKVEKHYANDESQRSNSCATGTGNDSSLPSGGSPNDMQLQCNQFSPEAGVGALQLAIDSKAQLEVDASHESVRVAQPSGESQKNKQIGTLERDNTLEETGRNSQLKRNCQENCQVIESSHIATSLPNSSLSSGLLEPAKEHDEKIDCTSTVPTTSNDNQSSQGSVSVGSPFVPMTQQVLDFDYLSQISEASVGTPQSASHCVVLKKKHLTCEPKQGLPDVDREAKVQPSPGYVPTIHRYNTMAESSFYGEFVCPDTGSNSNCRIGQNHLLDTAQGQLGFTSAKSDALIPVCEDTLLGATRQLANSPTCLVDEAMACGNVYSGSKSSINNYDYRTDSKAKDSPANNSFPSSHGFASAGSGSLIKISDESLVRATKLIAESNECMVHHEPTCADLHGVDATSHLQMKHLSTEETSSTPFGFTTAGSGVLIRVTDECLSRASKIIAEIYEDDEYVTSNDDRYPPSVDIEKDYPSSFDASLRNRGFACAGSGALIKVSEDCLSKASQLQKESSDCSVGRAISRGDEHDVNATSGTGYDGVLHGDLNDQCTSLGFVCAGSGISIKISDESLSRASKVLRNADPETRYDDGKNDHATLPLNDCIYPSSVATKMRLSINSHYSHSHLGFASAGSGALITVSDENLSRASDLLAYSNDCLVQRGEMCDYKLNTATSRASDEKYLTNKEPDTNCLPSTESSGAFLGFASAGSGSLIKVSAESLRTASTLLETSDDCFAHRELTSYEKDDDTEEGGQSSDESETITAPSIATKTFHGFASAGSGSLIRISDESLSQGHKLLSDSDSCLVDQDRTTICDEHKDADDDSNSPSTGEMPMRISSTYIPSIHFGFASAGTGTSISISEVSLSKASRLLADSKHCMGDDREIDGEQDVLKVRACGNSDNKCDTTTCAPFGSNEDCRRRKGRRHGNQKVRFSLDTSQLTTHRQSIERSHDFQDNRLSNVTPLVSDSGHATKLRANATGLTLPRSQSLITPDNRQIDEERVFVSINSNAVAQTFAESDHQSKVVTDRKDVQSSNRDQSFSSQTIHVSPRDRLMRTPLHEMTNVVEDPFQSVMKSKRLFQSTTFDSDELQKPKVRIAPCLGESIMRVASSKDVSTLSQFASNHHANQASNWADCIKYGVKDVTMRVTSVNACKLRFRVGDESPLFFLGQRDPPKCDHVGKISDLSEWLFRQECDKSLITDRWIQNHVRWIVWKLAAMERRFPIQLGGQYLTFSHVLSQIKGRYEKELRGAKRPALRKILNRDVSACTPIILCVSQVLRFKIKQRLAGDHESGELNDAEEVRLELSDGWYAISAILDGVLTNFVDAGKIRVGSKLMICNAQLVGSDEGVDPLDEGYSSDKRNCSIFLKIRANNSRLARWDAKLGFVHPMYTANQGGGILVKSLHDVYPNGGNIPAIDVVVCKCYPQMFLEQVKDAMGQTVSKSHLTETEEAARQNDHDMSYQRTSEQYADKACKECSEEVDEDAPMEWKEMVASAFPEDYYENLTASEQNIVDDWTKKRQLLMQNKMAKSIEGSVKDHSLVERTSVPYLRVLVKSVYRSKHKGRRAKKRSMTAELTIWRVSEEQLQLLKEGIAIRIKNVSVRCDHDGILQLSAKGDTHMESLAIQPTHIQLIRSGYEERHPKSLIYINLIAKKCEPNHLEREVDVVACIVKIQRLDNTTSVAYLTDESGFIMKLTRIHSSHNNDPFQLGNIETILPIVVELCNVQVGSFDAIDQCAIGSWGTFTCKAKHSMRFRRDEIQDWYSTELGLQYCGSILDRINAGLPSCATPMNRCIFCIGYILGFEVDDLSLEIIVVIDYGEEWSLIARFPFRLLLHALRLTQSYSSTFDGIDITSILAGNMFNRTNILSTCNALSEYFRRNQILFHFSLEKSSCYGLDQQLHEVRDISVATPDSLCRLNAMHLVGKYLPD